MGPIIPDIDELQHVTTVSLYSSSYEDCERGHDVLRLAPNVTSLSVSLADAIHRLDGKSSDGNCHEALTTIIPNSGFGNGEEQKYRLTKLQLRNFDFSDLGRLLPVALDLAHLRELSLSCCSETRVLLESLSEARLELKTLKNEYATKDTIGQGQLEKLLLCFVGLEELRISHTKWSGEFRKCSWSAIERHGPTLRSLYLDDVFGRLHFSTTPYDRSINSLLALCSKLTRLEQLAIRAPSSTKGEWVGEDDVAPFLICQVIHDTASCKVDIRVAVLVARPQTQSPTPLHKFATRRSTAG